LGLKAIFKGRNHASERLFENLLKRSKVDFALIGFSVSKIFFMVVKEQFFYGVM
jgi:hypothetical protein